MSSQPNPIMSTSSEPNDLSLAHQFSTLCMETPEPPTSPPHPSRDTPALSNLTDTQLHHLVQNSSTELYLSPCSIPVTSATRPDVSSAITAALQLACGPPPPSTNPPTHHPIPHTFAEWASVPAFSPHPALAELTWANSISTVVVEDFNDETERIRAHRQAAEAAEAQAAMKRAAATGARLSRVKSTRRVPSYSADPVIWAAQEEAAAAAVLRELRASPRRRSRDVNAWSLLGLRSGKLKPEAAAEMARARMAAAAAVAAMREGNGNHDDDDHVHSGSGPKPLRADDSHDEDENLYVEYLSPRTRARSSRLDSSVQFGLLQPPALPRSFSLDSNARLKNSKKKRVEFAADTIFKERK